MPTEGMAACSCVSSVPWRALRIPLISEDIEPVVSVTKATSTDWMFVLNLSTSVLGFGASLNGTMKKKSRWSLLRRMGTMVICAPAEPPSALATTAVVMPGGPGGRVATEVNVAPLKLPSSGFSRLKRAPAVTSLSPSFDLRITLKAWVAGVGGVVAVSMKRTTLLGSTTSPASAGVPKEPPPPPPPPASGFSGSVPGGVSLKFAGRGSAEPHAARNARATILRTRR